MGERRTRRREGGTRTPHSQTASLIPNRKRARWREKGLYFGYFLTKQRNPRKKDQNIK